MATKKPRIGVFKFASCDGCQLSLLDCEDELLAIADAVEIGYFLEATRKPLTGEFDIALVEGSISTPEQIEQIHDIRNRSRMLVTIGACATAGGIQALRNFADVREFLSAVYASPEYIDTLKTSTPIADHVRVDFELRGCPVSKHHLVELISATLAGRRPNIPRHSVCIDCKRLGLTCLPVAYGIPCLGPITQSGCGVICPSYHRGCYGCFGPAHRTNVQGLVRAYQSAGVPEETLDLLLHTFNAWAPGFRESTRSVPEELLSRSTGPGGSGER